MVWLQLLVVSAVALLCEAEPIDQRNKFILYYCTGNEVYSVSEGTQILQSSNFNNTKKTVLYIHGYIENQSSVSVQTVVSAYCARNDHNIWTLDWSEDASGNYLLALPKLEALAPVVAAKLQDMINAGLDVEKLHLVGHSMGGQMISRIANKLKTEYDTVLKRITALDPANPGFYGPLTKHIEKSDAEFVDIIHTDAGAYGGPISTGHADFWPNGGTRVQPGCPFGIFLPLTANDLCGHWRSWHFWAESVARVGDQKEFNAVSANSWLAFQNGNVENSGQTVVMGIDCPTNIEGDYYLQTNAQAPFARGPQGVTYTP